MSKVIVVQLPDEVEFPDVLRAFNAAVPDGCIVFGAVEGDAERVLRAFAHLDPTPKTYQPLRGDNIAR